MFDADTLCEALAEYIAGYACKQEVTPSDATKMFRKVMSKPGNQDRSARSLNMHYDPSGASTETFSIKDTDYIAETR